eukprot:jgi/Bigna1/88123/estExt_fgenesh1_pg.C_280116
MISSVVGVSCCLGALVLIYISASSVAISNGDSSLRISTTRRFAINHRHLPAHGALCPIPPLARSPSPSIAALRKKCPEEQTFNSPRLLAVRSNGVVGNGLSSGSSVTGSGTEEERSSSNSFSSSSSSSSSSSVITEDYFVAPDGSKCPLWKVRAAARTGASSAPPLLLVHPVGVGLGKWFWRRFIESFHKRYPEHDIYAPDMPGCGGSAPYYASSSSSSSSYTDLVEQWKEHLVALIRDPRHMNSAAPVVITQGALGTVGIELAGPPAVAASSSPSSSMSAKPVIRALVLSTPPSWEAVSTEFNPNVRSAIWNLLTFPRLQDDEGRTTRYCSPFGITFYKYATSREFLRKFSAKNLFSSPEAVTEEWLDELQTHSVPDDRRNAIIAFLAGLWRRDRTDQMKAIDPASTPIMCAFGSEMSTIASIDRKSTAQTLAQKYKSVMPALITTKNLPGRNLLPYESPDAFAESVGSFIQDHAS